jgi:hypothetical protein
MNPHPTVPGRPGSRPGAPARSRRRLAALLLLGLSLAGGALLLESRAEPPAAKAVADSTIAPDSTSLPHRVLATYFRTTLRCASCRKLEAWTQEAIETGFPGALKEGRLVFRVVNMEEKGNEHFVKDYQLFTKSVVLVDERNGKPAAWKNLSRIWELLNDKEQFVRYIQSETRACLDGKPS